MRLAPSSSLYPPRFAVLSKQSNRRMLDVSNNEGSGVEANSANR